ncbi:hypothetical protein [Aromatoleum toluclasticum]|uniref:hypothetical protein n=1 Tax=Aromatoleum toluclasticum TaxID=92003 RepID=UPI00037C3B8D|nr:hypothetical protein [Aromatoleum toluclasticum]
MPVSAMRPSRFRAEFFPAVLFVFMVSFFLPISAKASNNIFYAGLAVPAVIWWLSLPRLALEPYKAAPVFFACFGLFALLLGFRDVSFLKDSVYIAVLFLTCVMIEKNEGAVRRSFLAYSLVALALLVVATVDWVLALRTSGLAQRIALWGRTGNPIFAALMIISGLVFLWVFHVEARLARSSAVARWLGLLGLVGLCAACAVVFQARSALLGMAFFLVGYAVQRRYIKAVLIVLGLVVLVLLASGAGSILLERGASYRLDIWEAAIRRVVGECGVVFGCGKDQHLILGQFYHPHSAYVSAFYFGGLSSLLTFAAMAAAFFVLTWRARSSWLLVALVGWGGLLTDTNGVIASPRTLWVFFWIPVFMAVIESGRPALEAYYRARDGVRTPD